MATPYPSVPWDPLPRDPALHTVHDLPLAQSAAALAMLLDENKDEQILKEACLGLCQLFGEGIQNDRIQAILEADVVPRLVSLLKPNRARNVPVSVQAAALQVIGNVACGDDRQTQVIIDCDALPCLRALLSSNDRGIRKEVCWISSNITESSHQVQAVLDAGILPPLLKLLDSQDNACREDATWVLYNISSNHDMRQIRYLAEQNGVRALCNLLNCSKELDVLWKGCGTVAAVALKGLRNVLVAGQQEARNDPNGYNTMAALVAEAHGVERIEALTGHASADVRLRARLLLERFFGAEPAPLALDVGGHPDDCTNAANAAAAAAVSAAAAAVVSPVASLSHVTGSHFPDPEVAAAAAAAIADPAAFAAAAAAAAASTPTCSCPHPHPHPAVFTEHSSLMPSFPPASHQGTHESAHAAAAAAAAHFHASAVVAAAAAATGYHTHSYSSNVSEGVTAAGNGAANPPASPRALPPAGETNGSSSMPSSSGSSTDSDPEDDDSDSDLLPPPPAPCSCVLCTDTTPLADRRPRKAPPDGSSSAGSSQGLTSNGSGTGSSKRKGGAPGGGASTGVFSPLSGSTETGGRGDEEEGGGSVGSVARDAKSGAPAADSVSAEPRRTLCDFCSGGGRLGDGKAGLAAKLGRAVRLGHSHCVAILLSRMTWSQRAAATEAPALLHPGGGPPDSGVSSSLPAVVLAAHLGKPDCLALLLRRCRPDLDATHGKKRLTPLAWAAHKGYYKCCVLLLEHGANAASKCGDCLTALHLAASGGGHLAICNLLLDHGAPVNARSSKDQTPLCLATQKGYSRLVRLLLQNGADFNNEDEGKFTPLHIAASNGFAESAEELIHAGATIDCKTRNSITPLHYAVQGGHASVVKLLVSAGAKVNCTRKPLLIIAADDGNREVVQILLDALAAIDCTANIKATVGKDSVGKDIEIHDHLTPLHLAASKGHKDVVELLLRRGASVDARTEKGGWNALDFSVLNGHSACALTLLEYFATVTDNARKLSSHSLVQIAARQGNKDVVRMLLERLQEQKSRIMGALANAAAASGGASNISRATTVTFTGSAPSGSQMPAPPSPLSLSTPGGPSSVAPGAGPSDVYGTTEIDVASLGSASHVLPPLSTCSHGSNCPHLSRDAVSTGGGHGKCHTHPHQSQSQYSASHVASQTSSNRYDPRSSEGDESGFGTGPGYGNGPAPAMNGIGSYVDDVDDYDGANISNAASSARVPGAGISGSSSRRRATKDDHAAAVKQREREIKRREMEGNDALERLREAVALASIAKISEAINNASKLFLQSQNNAAVDSSVPAAPVPPGSLAADGLEDPYGTGLTGGQGSIDLTSSASVSPPPAAVGNTSQTTVPSHAVALQIEAELRVQVSNARKYLAKLQLEDRKAKDRKAKEAAELKKENNQLLLRKAMAAVLEGGDLRTLTRSINRAKRAILEDDDSVVLEANKLVGVVQGVEKAWSSLRKSLDSGEVNSLSSSINAIKQSCAALLGLNGEAAAARAFGGKSVDEVLSNAENILRQRVKERDSAEAEKAAAKAQEESAMKELRTAVQSGILCDIERSLEGASLGLISKDSDSASEIEAAKKSFGKSLKSERRKLRQANASNDVTRIDAAVAAADELNLKALKGDIATSVELVAKLREQRKRRGELEEAIAARDAQRISEIRTHLQALGMFSEAETARAELDSLQRAARARSLLGTARADAQQLLDLFRSRSGSEALEAWSWPDGQRLCDLVKRTRGNFGGSLDSLCSETEALARDLALAGREAVAIAVSSEDTRLLAGAIAGYEKSFVNVVSSSLFDTVAGADTLKSARVQLSALQAKEQENVRAEAAQVKTEYAMATSRRSAARSRGSRRGRQTGGNVAVSQSAPGPNSESVASTNSSDCGDDNSLDAEISASPQVGDDVGRLSGGGSRPNGFQTSTGSSVGVAAHPSGPAESDCSHYYLWKEGTTVQCARCSNIRESVNGEWLQRVKKRGVRAPPEIAQGVGPPHAGSVIGVNSSAGGPPVSLASSSQSGRGTVQTGGPTGAMGTATTGSSHRIAKPEVVLPSDNTRMGTGMVGEKATLQRHGAATRGASHTLMTNQGGLGALPHAQPPSTLAQHAMAPQGTLYAGDIRHGSLHRQHRPMPDVANRQTRSHGHSGVPGSVPQVSQYSRVSSFPARQTMQPQQSGEPVGNSGPVGRGGSAVSSVTGIGGSRMRGVSGLSSTNASHVTRAAPSVLPDRSAGSSGRIPNARVRHVASSTSLHEGNAVVPEISPHGTVGTTANVPHGAPAQGHSTDEAVMDLSTDFANENFGFDIDSLLVEK